MRISQQAKRTSEKAIFCIIKTTSFLSFAFCSVEKSPEFLGVNFYETRRMVFKTMVKVKKRGDFIVFTKNARLQMVNWWEIHC